MARLLHSAGLMMIFSLRLTMAVSVFGWCMATGAWLPAGASAQTAQKLTIRGHEQTVYVSGSPAGTPVIVSSGDGGWIHLAPDVARILAAKQFYVIGFDSRAYLSSFTSDKATLQPQDEAGDYLRLVEFASQTSKSQGSAKKPILIGVSEGAGLSVLAATDPRTKAAIAGVIGLGLPNVNELAWRWRDALIYITHGIPNEPTFQTTKVVDQMAPLPLAAIHSTRDEFVSATEVQDVLAHAQEPKKLWFVSASNHRFSDNLPEFEQRLLEAITWVTQNSPR
jgi:pimeloyl-ACP methyl ester carboxylesterase